MIIPNRVIFLLLILLFCGVAYAEENMWIRVEGGFWQPSDKVLSKIKIHLEPYMRAQEKVFGRSIKKWDTYHFQYQGQEENGRKYVYINAFCDLHHLKGVKLNKGMVFVHDGGGCFFHLKYDPIADKFYEAIINGEA